MAAGKSETDRVAPWRVNAGRQPREEVRLCSARKKTEKVKGTVWKKIKNTRSGNRTWGPVQKRHTINSY